MHINCPQIVSDLVFELFITFCILLNVIVMAMEFHGMSTGLRDALAIANFVFTGIFTLEAIIKILALSSQYFKSGWNNFDLFIVVISLVDLCLINQASDLGFLKAFRLVRFSGVPNPLFCNSNVYYSSGYYEFSSWLRPGRRCGYSSPSSCPQ
jgi:hypothetical protein